MLRDDVGDCAATAPEVVYTVMLSAWVAVMVLLRNKILFPPMLVTSTAEVAGSSFTEVASMLK